MIFKVLSVEPHLTSSRAEHPETVAGKNALDSICSQNINLFNQSEETSMRSDYRIFQKLFFFLKKNHVFPI